MKTWEYLKIWDETGIEKMNELGKQGWELVGTGVECGIDSGDFTYFT